jgi:hypothetical protein
VKASFTNAFALFTLQPANGSIMHVVELGSLEILSPGQASFLSRTDY